MSTLDQTYKQYSFADHKDVYLKLERAFTKFNIHYYLIGANARDVQLYKAGIKPSRGTADIDFAVMVPTLEKYEELIAHLRTIGFEETYGKQPYRLFHEETNTVIDLLPYGEFTQDNTVQFNERSLELSIIGFQEVGEEIERFDHPEGITLPVSPVHGIVLLKMISWSEKPERTKDLKDIKQLLESAWELYQDEAYMENSVHADLFDDDSFDIHRAAARIMGRKMQATLRKNEQLKNEVYKVLETTNETTKLGESMAAETNHTVEEVDALLNAMWLGLEDDLNE